MLSTSVLFNSLSIADIRPIRADLFMSFTKLYTPGLPGNQLWDKYPYENYTSRIIDIEWERYEQEYASVSLATADFVLNNYDDYFSVNSGSPISGYILPGRPVKIYPGFGSETIQSLVGMTDSMPDYDNKQRTVTFHVVDFLSSILNKSLDEELLLVNKRTDEVLRALFTSLDFTSDQLDLSVGFNLIPFAYFQKGTRLLDEVFKLMEAEGGRLFMSEDGKITFRNRRDYSTNPVMYLTPYRNIVSSVPTTKDELINVVQVEGGIRTVQPLQPYGRLSTPVKLNPGAYTDIWIDFPDPVTSVTTPAFIFNAVNSYWNGNMESDGSGSQYEGAGIIGVTLFAKSAKVTFISYASVPFYVTELVLYATPAPITQQIYVREEDTDSVDKYGERVLSINNDYFGDLDNANSKAQIITRMFANAGEVKKLEIKGNPALQLDDVVNINRYDTVGDYRIIGIRNRISLPGKYTQILTLGKTMENNNYFTIELSQIGGDDMIAP